VIAAGSFYVGSHVAAAMHMFGLWFCWLIWRLTAKKSASAPTQKHI
jgi:hypothetical protein